MASLQDENTEIKYFSVFTRMFARQFKHLVHSHLCIMYPQTARYKIETFLWYGQPCGKVTKTVYLQAV